MNKISLIMPFRERILLLNNLFTSLKRTTRHPERVEVIMAIDEDDQILNNYTTERIQKENKEFDIRFYRTTRSDHFIRDYWNPAAKLATGRWIMAINDDALFMTPKWDMKIDEEMTRRAEEFGDDIIYGKTYDCCKIGGRDPNTAPFSCWCLQGWETQKALGFFYDPEIWVWGPDQVCGLMFLRLFDVLGEDRYVNILDVVIDHNSFHTEKREKDNLYYHQEAIDKAHHFQTSAEHETKYAFILKDYIEKKRGKK